jgi:hypothetical protein
VPKSSIANFVPKLRQALQDGQGFHGISHQDTFSGFELEARWCDAGLLDHVGHSLTKSSLA